MYGLSGDEIRQIQQVLMDIESIQQVVLYGSRAKGNYRAHSDIDITLKGQSLTLDNSVYPLMDALDDLLLPYEFDVSIFDQIDNADLIEHIEAVGVVFYGVGLGRWPMVKLGDISEVITKGTTPTSVGFKFTETGINFIKIESIASNGHFLPRKFSAISNKCNESLKRSQLKEGDILFSIAGALGRTALVTRDILPANTNQALAIIRLMESVEIDKHYLLLALTTSVTMEQVERNKGGVAQQNLSLGQLKNFKIPLPSIPVQKRIVDLLDQAFANIDQARAKTEKNLKNARELFESYLQQVFSQRGEGWVEMNLKEVSVDFGRGKSKHRPRNDESLYGGAYPFIQTGDVRNCEHLITKHSKTYNDKGLAQSKLWPKGTICITIAANIAETGILDFAACFPDSVIGVVVDSEITIIRYVEYLLQSFKAILKSKGHGSAQDNINMGTFENMKFPFPSVEVQEEMVSNLDELMISVQELERVYSNKLSDIEELKTSLLKKAFNGELTNPPSKNKSEGAA